MAQVTNDTGSSAKPRSWTPWVLSGTGVALGLVRLLFGFQNYPFSAALGLAIGLAVSGLVFAITLRWYHRSVRRMLRLARLRAWVRGCVDPVMPELWQAVALEGTGVRILKRSGTAEGPWPYHEIGTVDIGPVPVGLLEHTGVILHLRSGNIVQFLLPSRDTLHYPIELARQCVTEIHQRAKLTVPTDTPPTGAG
jgi:hypothetical protein